MKDSEQAQHALDYLNICRDIQLGGFGSELSKRDLDETEQQVKDKALRTLSIYFGSTASREDESKPKRSRRKKKVKDTRMP